MLTFDALPERRILAATDRSARFVVRVTPDDDACVSLAPRLVLALDRSSSMRGARFFHAKRMAAGLIALLPDGAELTLLAYDARVSVVVAPIALDESTRADAYAALSALEIGHGTHFEAVLDRALTLGADGAHVVLLTDGYPSCGQTAIGPLVERVLRRERTTLTTLGIGRGSHDLLLSSLARAGGGDAHFAEDLGDAHLGDAHLNDASRGDASLDDASLDDASLDDASVGDASAGDASPGNANLGAEDIGRALGREHSLMTSTLGTDVDLLVRPAPEVRLDKLWYRGPAGREDGARIIRLPRLVAGRPVSIALQLSWTESASHLGLAELRFRDRDGCERRREVELRAEYGPRTAVDPVVFRDVLIARLHTAVHDAAVDGTPAAPRWLAERLAALVALAEQEQVDDPELHAAFELARNALDARGPRALARRLEADADRSLAPRLRDAFRTSILAIHEASRIVPIDR